VWFDPGVASRILEHYRPQVAPAQRAAARLKLLTERERAVLRLMASDATNGEITVVLYVAEAR
jgi:DNA-binding NarL/FixJ family response regulator